ncbi:hypothetical protein BD779DRAFT_397876 [Infundibulicybe gibba]|nr:hypothetical protein BD779DRAFT_397876 [Infundibulicybe gibba]
MTSKRKRTDIDDSDEDEPSFGRQILPVADLPDDFHDTPVDGLQYLFTVRRDARQLPQVTRVENPYETTHSPPLHTTPKPDCSHLLPSAEWRSSFEIRCKNLRLNMAQPTIHIQFTPKTDPIRLMPDKKDRDLWWAFLSGKPESEWNPPKQPKQPKRRSFMRGFADDPYQYEEGKPSDGVDLYANQEENTAGGTQSLPTPSGTPAPSDASDQLASLNARSNPVANSLQPREPTMSLLQHIDEVGDQKVLLH